MKNKQLWIRLLLVFNFFVCIEMAVAQNANGFNYQAIVRNATGVLMLNQNVDFKLHLIENSPTATPIYTEIHNVTTDDLGQVNLIIGKGVNVFGDFATINWSSTTFFLMIELNVGNGFVAMGTTQLMSVPFAMYAQKTADNGIPNGSQFGQMLYWNGAAWATLAPGTNGTTLRWCADQPTWGSCKPKIKIINIQKDLLTENTVVLRYNLQDDGGEPLTGLGAIYGISPNPSENTYTAPNLDYGIGIDTFKLTNINYNTTYYFKVFATNSVGISVSETISFMIQPPAAPIVETTLFTPSVTYSKAIAQGTIINNNGSLVTSKGFVWSTVSNPTILSNSGMVLVDNETDVFSATLLNLLQETTYYVKAFATNAIGTTYGSELNITTASRISGSYKVIQGEYWRINVYRPDITWVDQIRTIQKINETTNYLSDWCGPFEMASNSHYFTINAANVVNVPNVIFATTQLFNGLPSTNCIENPTLLTNACNFAGPQNIYILDNVNGKDRIYRTYGYNAASGPREFYEVLEKIVD